MAFDERETRDYLAFRVTIASGLFASLGATLAWILWLAYELRNPELATTVIVGAVVGVLVEWFRHYLHLASHEREQTGGKDPGGNPRPPPRLLWWSLLRWAAGFGFLGLVSEHLISDMAARFLQPLLGSLATLLPAGMILGLTMHLGKSKQKEITDVIFSALVPGLAVGGATGFIWWLGWGNVPWGPLLGWWCLVSMGMRFFTPSEVNSTRFYQPLCGIATAFVLLVVVTLLPMEGILYNVRVIGNVVGLAKGTASTVVNAPRLPSTFWLEADKTAGIKEPGQLVAQGQGQVSSQQDRLTKDNLERAASPGSFTSSNSDPSWPLILAELRKGFTSDFVRSWLILVFFAIGLGLAPMIERSLRPADYPSSATFRKDVKIAFGLLVAVVIACGYARLHPSPSTSEGSSTVAAP